MNALIGTLREDELDLLRDTEPDRMAALDEDDLLDLHSRVRRARTKYVKLYRRQASSQVKKSGGRGKGRPKNRRNADKAEVFEDALARLQSPTRFIGELKTERLAAARKESPGPQGAGRDAQKGKSPSRPRAHTKTTGGRKRDAATRAKGARRQAKRDSR